MIESSFTLYKLIILYMLQNVNFPLSNTQISDFILEKEYTNYFHLQEALSELQDTKVFVDLIKQSKPNTYMIMVSHAMYPQIDPDHPSSLSKKIITDWLRKDMGYNGVVVTDDMDMGALAKHYTFGDMAVQSIQAGSDILLVCHEYEHMQEAYNGLMKAVKDGTISKERLDASVKRILLMKMSHGL